MGKAKRIFAILMIGFAIVAVSSASADAANEWSVNGVKAFGTEAISNAIINIPGGELEGDGIRVACPKMKIEEGEIKAGKTGTAKSAIFSECVETVEETNCELSSSMILTFRVKAEVVGVKEVEFAPEGTTEFTTIKINNRPGKTCVVKGVYKVTGTARASLTNVNVEEFEHAMTFNGFSALKINNNASTIVGSGNLKLTSGDAWSIQ
jgi:hypothetical protein